MVDRKPVALLILHPLPFSLWIDELRSSLGHHCAHLKYGRQRGHCACCCKMVEVREGLQRNHVELVFVWVLLLVQL